MMELHKMFLAYERLTMIKERHGRNSAEYHVGLKILLDELYRAHKKRDTNGKKFTTIIVDDLGGSK